MPRHQGWNQGKDQRWNPGLGWATMFKFLHAADIHLDSPLRGLDRHEHCPSDQIRGATRQALDQLVQVAIEEQVAFVVIAGDLYDGDWKDHHTGLWLVSRLSRLREAGIRVFLIRGNHDAQNKMTVSLRMPSNVHQFSVKEAESVRLDHLDTVIHGQGFAQQAVLDDLSARYPAAVSGCFNLGLLHTSVNGREGHDRYAPCTVEALRQKGYGYWALGHIHKRETLAEGETTIVFPGNIQGRHIKEDGPKGCLIVTVDQNQVVATDFRPLDVLRWETHPIQASLIQHHDDIPARFEEALPSLIQKADDRFLAVRVEVVGESPIHDSIRGAADQLTRDIQSTAVDLGDGRVWVEKVKVRVKPPRQAKADPLDGPFLEIDRYIRDLQTDDARLNQFVKDELDDLFKKVRPILASDTLDVSDLDWLRGMLDEVRPLLARQFDEMGGATS